MNIPEISIKRPVTVLMIILIIIVLGTISLTRLGLDLMPDITFPTMAVVVGYEGVGPEDVEKVVTKPLEEIIATVKNAKELTSFSIEGLSALMVEFEWGTNLDAASQDIRDRIDMYTEFLPEDMDKPMIIKFDPSMFPVAVFGVTGDRDLESLFDIVDKTLKSRLEQVDGVASTIVWGGYEREIRVKVRRNKMEAYNLSLDDIGRKIAAENVNRPGGYLIKGYEEFLVRTVGEFEDVGDIENIIISIRNNTPIYLKDVAEVSDTHKEMRAVSRTNKKESILLVVNKESGANTVLVYNRVNDVLKKLELELPQDIKINTVFNMARIIKRILNVTGSNALFGGLLAVILLYFFLRNWRPTLAISLAIPLSLLATFLPLYFLGFTMNFIVLIGIALGVGMMVDNSIVVIENTFRHLSLGEDRMTSARRGASEVGMAVTASTLTTVVVFLPLFFAGGITGRLFRELATTVSFTLLASLFIALTIVPMFASRIFKPRTPDEYDVKFGKRRMSYFQGRYKMLLERAMKHRLGLILGVIIIFVLSIVLAISPIVGKEFFPKIDNSTIMMMLKMPVETNIDETDRICGQIEDIIMEEEGVETVSMFAGVTTGGKADAAFGTGPAGVNEAQFFIKLEDKLKRKRSSHEIVDSIRRKLPELLDTKFEFSDLGLAMMTEGGAQGAPIRLKIFGEDRSVLEDIGGELTRIIGEIEGVFDADFSIKPGKAELRIETNKEKATRYGLTVGQIAQAVNTALQGQVVAKLRERGEEIDIRVELDEVDRDTLKEIEKLPIATPLSTYIRLEDVATITEGRGPKKLTRQNQKTVAEVTANFSGKSLNIIESEIEERLKDISLPPGYFIERGGQFEKMRDMFISLGQIFLLAILLIYMVMAAQFESLVHPLVIMFTIPLSIIGVILAIVVTGKSIALPSGMGVVILSGIIVNNAIVLVDTINRLRKQGMDRYKAVIEAGIIRFRPILMTASTTTLAMLPMALSRAEGGAVRSIVAISIIGGLIIGTFLTLFVIPILYNLFDNWASRIAGKAKVAIQGER